MKPRKPDNSPDLFRSQLSQILNLSHPLVRLSQHIDWEALAAQLDTIYSAGCGQPPLPSRLLIGLHYLKYAFNESDESVVTRWVENPYWQYFCGYEHLQHDFPLHPTSLTKWRNRVGDKLECLLQETIRVAQSSGQLKRSELTHVNIDTTVQEKAIAFPTDARLYHKAREVLVKEAKHLGIELRQTYVRVSKRALIKQGRYAHARQMKRAKKQTSKLKTYLGRVIRDIERQTVEPSERLLEQLRRAKQIHAQQQKDQHKLYAMHAPEVLCMSKGKLHKRYEFGNKVSYCTTSKSNWIIGAQSYASNRYDGHTLSEAIEQVRALTGRVPCHAYVDQGYRGHGHQGETTVHIVGKIPKKASRSVRKWYKRRSSIEPSIGHLKSDHRLSRNHLKGELGDRINAVLAAAGYNLAKLLAWICCVCVKLRLHTQMIVRNALLTPAKTI